ncbi:MULTISPECIES: hypothetical protein [unclassified Streptomyces]|uniref:hypothetical protein n=1 Tax=unclassified Streptomyces TaxID=2593676 RepID=UPI00037CB4AA|nr:MULTISPECIES: hypothetical protein [unclassified Streptomyces]MYX33881.1 hypothetical protein [Streptomyces sp. SID8377]
MERRRAPRPELRGTIGDRHWRADLRRALGCALAFLCLAVPLDAVAGTLTPRRAALWLLLAVIVLVLLHPDRVTAGDGWPAVRGPLRERRVRTDALTLVRQSPGVSRLLLLCDAHGRWLELDPRVLEANPLLWHRLEAGARRSRTAGTFSEGEEVLRRLGERIDGATARSVLDASWIG